MTSPPASTDAKRLIDLAERLGMPADAAIRQVGRIIAELDRRSQPATSEAAFAGDGTLAIDEPLPVDASATVDAGDAAR